MKCAYLVAFEAAVKFRLFCPWRNDVTAAASSLVRPAKMFVLGASMLIWLPEAQLPALEIWRRLMGELRRCPPLRLTWCSENIPCLATCGRKPCNPRPGLANERSGAAIRINKNPNMMFSYCPTPRIKLPGGKGCHSFIIFCCCEISVAQQLSRLCLTGFGETRSEELMQSLASNVERAHEQGLEHR